MWFIANSCYGFNDANYSYGFMMENVGFTACYKRVVRVFGFAIESAHRAVQCIGNARHGA